MIILDPRDAFLVSALPRKILIAILVVFANFAAILIEATFYFGNFTEESYLTIITHNFRLISLGNQFKRSESMVPDNALV